MVTQNGDIEILKLKITNGFATTNPSLGINVVLPAGLAYSSHAFKTESGLAIPNPSRANLVIGSPITGSIVNASANEVIVLHLSVLVVDISLAVSGNFTVTGTVTSAIPETNPGDNSFTKTIGVTTCAPSAGPVSFTTACSCFSLAQRITPCTNGTTEYRLKAGSLVNISDFTLNATTGEVNLVQTNPVANSTFVYEIWCIVGPDEFFAGEGTVTRLRQFASFPVSGGGGDVASYFWAEVIPGTTGNTLDLTTIFTVACSTGSPSYAVEFDPAVYENVSVVGDILTYDVKAGAPTGPAELIVTRNCI